MRLDLAAAAQRRAGRDTCPPARNSPGVSRPCQAGCDPRTHRAHCPGARARHRRGRHGPRPRGGRTGRRRRSSCLRPGRVPPPGLSPCPTAGSGWSRSRPCSRCSSVWWAAVVTTTVSSDQVVGGSVGVDVAEARAQEQRILNQRARAVRDRDLDLFLQAGRPLRQGAGGAADALLPQPRAAPARPLRLPGHRPPSGRASRSPKRWGDDVHIPQVRMTMQLAGLRRGARRAHGRVRVRLPRRPGRARLGPDRAGRGRSSWALRLRGT